MSRHITDGFRKVARADALPDNYVVTCYLEDHKRRISVARVGGRLHAFDDLCPCADRTCALSGGLFTGSTIKCRGHGSRFDIATGAVVDGPATEALHVYEVQEVNGDVRVRPSA